MKLFIHSQKNFILKTIRKDLERSDKQIAFLLIKNKMFQEYESKPDTLRRYISFIRDWEFLRITQNKKQMKKDILELIK